MSFVEVLATRQSVLREEQLVNKEVEKERGCWIQNQVLQAHVVVAVGGYLLVGIRVYI